MKYRAEVDGIRALAVLPVILFHAGFESFSGGYVGVDVFFVISGYLITTIIILEMIEEKFSVINFYERRARRILPALFFVMAVCLPLALFFLSPGDLINFGKSLVAVSTFSSNFLFWLEAGYFDTNSELKPLLHTWSLAVEEQYYIIFPIFLIVVWQIGIRWITFILFLIFLTSLCLAQWGAYNSPAATFFLLPTRGWELLIGVFTAIYLKYYSFSTSFFINQLLSLLGLSMIVYSIVAFDETTPFPSLYTLIPTIGSSLLIICTVPNTLAYKLFNLKPLVLLGLISYSVYLWHQPILAFMKYQLISNEPSNILMLALCLLSILIGWFSWRFIEKPFRKRDSVSKKNIFIFSLSGILIFSFLGSSIFINNGFAEIKYKKINEKLLNMGIIDFEFNNKKLQEQSWNILRTISNNESYGVGDNNYDLNHFSDLNSEKERILFVGNSHSKDLFNIFYYNIEINEKFEIARFGIQLHDIKSNFFETFSYKNSDVIIIISKYSEDDLKILYDLASKIANDNKKLFIVEELFHFPTLGGNTFSDRLIKQELSKSNVSLDELINKVNFEHTKYFLEKKSSEDWTIRNQLFNDISIKIKKDIPQVNFLNRMDYICPNNYCSVLTKTGNKIFYDYGHHTLKGALYFSRKINNTKFYKDLLIGLDKKMFLNSSPPITKEK